MNPSSDESSVEPSTRPTTPELSPQLLAQMPDNALHTQFTHLSVQNPQNARPRTMRDFSSDIFADRTVIKKVCIVGAGYVGTYLQYLTLPDHFRPAHLATPFPTFNLAPYAPC